MIKHKFILYNDHSYSTTKKSAKKIYRKNKDKKSEIDSILIPIAGYDNAFMPVKVNKLMNITYGCIKYHMQLMLCGSSVDTTDDIILLNYYPTEIEIVSYEELLMVFHNITSMMYVEHSTASNCTEMNIPYMDIVSISIELYTNKKLVYSFSTDTKKSKDLKEIPFKYTGVSYIVDTIAKDLGLAWLTDEYSSFEMSYQKIEFIQDKKRTHWELSKYITAIRSNTIAVGIINPLARTIILMDDMVYDDLLIISKSQVYIAILELGAVDPKLENIRKNIPLYTMTYDETPQDLIGVNEWEIYDDIVESYSYILDAPDDIMIFITYIPHIIRLYREVIKGMIFSGDQFLNITNDDEYYGNMDSIISVYLDMTLYLDDPNMDRYIRIATDAKAIELPNINSLALFLRRNL